MAPKLSNVLQYLILGIVGYIFAGAPLRQLFFDTSSPQDSADHFPWEKSELLAIPDENLTCPYHGYNVHLFSTEPLIIYIESFLSNEEAEHIVQISESKFSPSTVWTEGVEQLDDTVRRSEKALLDRDDIVKCVEERARVFQGWRPYVYIEKLWSQRYSQDGFYRHHYDWGSTSSNAGRISSFMVYLEANCTGGGTNFPRLKTPGDKKWCTFLECEGEDEHEGVTFKPIKGNAIFWENIRPDGTGYKECWHAGLPVQSGTKIGLNIWSWYQKGYRH